MSIPLVLVLTVSTLAREYHVTEMCPSLEKCVVPRQGSDDNLGTRDFIDTFPTANANW